MLRYSDAVAKTIDGESEYPYQRLLGYGDWALMEDTSTSGEGDNLSFDSASMKAILGE